MESEKRDCTTCVGCECEIANFIIKDCVGYVSRFSMKPLKITPKQLFILQQQYDSEIESIKRYESGAVKFTESWRNDDGSYTNKDISRRVIETAKERAEAYHVALQLLRNQVE